MPLWTPADLAVPPTIWFSAQRSTRVESGGAINSIQNLGSLGGSFTFEASDLRPVYSATGWDGTRPSIYFDEDTLRLDWAYTGNRLAIFGVSETDGGGDGGARLVANRTNARETWNGLQVTGILRDNSTHFISVRNEEYLAFPVGDNVKHSWGAVYGAAGRSLRADGGAATTDTQVGSFAFDFVRIGAEAIGKDMMFGKFVDHLQLAYEPTTDERQKVEGFLAWEWGIQSMLPLDHPYRSAPPETGGGGVDAPGALVGETYSVVAGAASAGASAPGAMVGEQYAVVAGAASAEANAAGALVGEAYLVVAGAASVDADAPGSLVGEQYSVVAGAASTTVDAAGALVGETYSVVAGAVSVDTDAPGALVGFSYSVIPGAASTSNDVNAPGALVGLIYEVMAGAVSVEANAPGALVGEVYSVLPGAASTNDDVNVPGAIVGETYSVLAGAASVDANAPGALVGFAYSVLPGAAGIGVFAPGALVGEMYSVIPGAASITPGTDVRPDAVIAGRVRPLLSRPGRLTLLEIPARMRGPIVRTGVVN